MPNWPLEIPPSAEGLKTYLERVLPSSRLTNAVVDSAYQPLLLLQTSTVMAAFAFSNGDIGETYNTLYGGFKKYYAKQQSQWRDLDLAFVFCVPPEAPQVERFCSKIETDVYFCRKYVIPFGPKMEVSLARLPFLPLAPVGARPFRPPSAQTYLQQCGVRALLARYLVVQHQRGPKRIVEDCISGKFGKPLELTPKEGASAHIAEAGVVARSVRLEKVEIQSFRAYRKPQTFVIGDDVTVLYGPNGFGKTSFFDAIDFAVTGGIGRIRSRNEAHFKKTARHLDSMTEESSVELSFVCGGVLRKIKRTVNNRKRGLLNDKTVDRKAILAEVTGGNIPSADRVENFISLFRATHLFSQEQQELARNFQDDCQLSQQIVSRMLAFEDYANAVNKAAAVHDELQGSIKEAQDNIREVSKQIISEKKELERLAKLAPGDVKASALEAEIASLRHKLGEAGISVTTEEPELKVVRSWRTTVEARLADSETRIAHLSGLTKDVADLRRLTDDSGALERELADKEQLLAEVNDMRAAAEQKLQSVQKRLAEIRSKRADAQTRAELIGWARITKPRYQQLLHKQQEIGEGLNRATALLTEQRASAETAAADLQERERLLAQTRERLTAKRAELLTVHNLTENAVVWAANRTRLSAVIELEQQTLNSIDSMREEEQELASKVADLKAEETRLSDLISDVDRNQSQLKKLLSQLQAHVRNGICPLCGQDYGSQEGLLRRIQKEVATDAASSARVELTQVRERLKQVTASVTDSAHKHQVASARLAGLRDERAGLTKAIADFANSAAKLSIDIDPPGRSLGNELQVLSNRVQQEIAVLNKENQEGASMLAAAHSAAARTKEEVAATEAEVTTQRGSLAQLQEEVNRDRNDPRSVQISLDMEGEQLSELERVNLANMNELGAEAVKAEADVAQQKQHVSALNQESGSIRTQLTGLRTKLANLQRTVTQISSRVQQFKLPPDSSQDTILALIAEESRNQATLAALRDSVSNLELVIDTATTAAALTRLIQSVRNKEMTVTNTRLSLDRFQPWLTYFGQISRLLASEQEEAIANFTSEYGPRTSVIQQRLRSVYGFDEIEVRGHGSAISVRVNRRGEELLPTDYFSQSQQQTLLLGLFLTACISQTWSALSPVFLDDPVTHFDDLNTYAFLDLILGLVESDVGKRQFVISTCDEKLLQLARHKFRHLRERAKFYEFSAIGAEGPVVEEI